MKHTILYQTIGIVVAGIVCFLFFRIAYPYHLIHREQTLLFAYTSELLAGYFCQPAPLSCLVGDFLTQFFYSSGTASAIVSVVLVLLDLLVFFIVRRWTGGWMAFIVAWVVVLWEAMRLCHVGYPLSGSISLIGALGLFLCVSAVKGRWESIVCNWIGAVACYLLFGYGLWAFLLLVLADAVAHRKSVLINCAVAALSLSVPAIVANRYLIPVSQAYIYPSTTWYGTPDMDDERILGLDIELHEENYERVLQLVYDGKPSNIASVCYNLANAARKQLPDKLMDYYQPAALGLFIPVGEQSTYLSTQLAGEVWFRLGDMTMAEHAAILSMIFSPRNQNARMVQRLAEINLINGDTDAARKYLRILRHTWHYRQWATDRMPGSETEEVKAWLKAKQSLIPQSDTLRLTTTDIAASLHLLLEANPSNQMARDYLLCFELLQKDISAFADDYKNYYVGAPGRLYSEGLMIDLFRRRASAEETKASGIQPTMVRDFNEYNGQYARSQGSPVALENRFGRSYWFYFQFAQFQ